ncbi:MAG: sulfotransferase [Phycisphaerales bacterium]|nr:sulfotransferase [Phycisphaerales bacterium]
MRVPGKIERILWYTLWGRNPVTLAAIGLLPHRRVDRPIFILGSPRSGTSVFSRIFGAHPELANWSEGHFLFDPHYRNQKNEHRWTEKDVTAFGARRLRSNIDWYCRYISLRQRLNAHRFTNKLPRNTLRVPWLLSIFPDAEFVHIIRDGRAVVRSMIRVMEKQHKQDRTLADFARPPGWQEYYRADPYEAHARQWAGIEDTVQSDLEKVPAERVCRAKYEEFILDTRNIMRRMCAQFGLQDDDRAVACFPEHLENRNSKWPTECTPQQIETMRPWVTPLLIKYGYESREDWTVPGQTAGEARPEAVRA